MMSYMNRNLGKKCSQAYPAELLDNGGFYLDAVHVVLPCVIRRYQRFRFCGDLDAPDWLLAEIATISRMVRSQPDE